MNRKLNWWQIGLVTLGVSAIGALLSRKPGKSERQSFERYKQAPWAPPPWAFGPAWTVNNYLLITALQRLLTSDKPAAKNTLYLQIPIWFVFFSFGYVYGHKKSPVLAAVWTIADTALAAASFAYAKKVDNKTANHFLPLLGWTTYASSVAVYQAVKNNDPVLKTEAVV